MSYTPQDPIVDAVPPATDYLTYLTIVEHNLSIENLGKLFEVLQDETLTINIGWDLLQLLLPFLPQSKECLHTIASLGNPREVLLKATEALRFISHDVYCETQCSDEESSTEPVNESEHQSNAPSVSCHEHTAEESLNSRLSDSASLSKFEILLDILKICHARLNTRRPSRFLATTLQAVLAAFSSYSSKVDELASTVLTLVEDIVDKCTQHWEPGPREFKSRLAPDPEADQIETVHGDEAIQKRLLLSFVTFVIGTYASKLPTENKDMPGWCWSSRLQEILCPGHVVPNRTTFTDLLSSDEAALARTAVIEAFASLVSALQLTDEALTSAALKSNPDLDDLADSFEEDAPNSSEDIALSPRGSIILLARSQFNKFTSNISCEGGGLKVFPHHSLLLSNFFSNGGSEALSGVRTESEAVLDSLLVLGLIRLHSGEVGVPENDEQFNLYLQKLSLISAVCPSPALRYSAHYLASNILQKHQSENVRLAFIKDTLEHCPYENLKASAVWWLKEAILDANKPPYGKDHRESIFATPTAINSTAPTIFVDLTQILGTPSTKDRWITLKINLNFYLAVLNFYILLLSSPVICERLEIGSLHLSHDIGSKFLRPLRKICAEGEGAMQAANSAPHTYESTVDSSSKADIILLEDRLDAVEEGLARLNSAA